MTSLCVATSYTTNIAPLGDICAATLRRYAKGFRCSSHVEVDAPNHGRHPAWRRVQLIPELFEEGFDFVLWVDADAMFHRFDRNVLRALPLGKDLGMVQYNLPWHPTSPVPNTGVMLVKNCAWSISLFAKLWSMTEYLNHFWWEQGAFIDLLGYRDTFNTGLPHEPNEEMLSHIHFMGEEWNNHPLVSPPEPVIIRHYAGLPFDQRYGLMRRDAEKIGLTV